MAFNAPILEEVTLILKGGTIMCSGSSGPATPMTRRDKIELVITFVVLATIFAAVKFVSW